MAENNTARPTGVTVIGVLSIVGGVLGVLGGIALLFGGAIFAGIVGDMDMAGGFGGALGATVAIMGLISAALSAFGIFVGVAFLGMKPWAWTATAILTVINLALSLMNVNLLGAAISAVILYYLFTKTVKAVFKATFGPSF